MKNINPTKKCLRKTNGNRRTNKVLVIYQYLKGSFCINHYRCANLKYDIDFEMSWVKDQGSCISNGVNKIMQ